MNLTLSTLIFEGADAATFLQGQITADIHQLDFIEKTNSDCGLAALCTQKGRVISLLWIIKKEDTQYHLLLPEELAEKVRNYLSRYIFRAKVTITLAEASADDLATLPQKISIPWITDLTSEKYIPQMLSLDILKAIHFKKGCYTGQEIVARMQYLGTHKRRLALIECKIPNQFTINAKLVINEIGEIGEIVYYNNNQALAVIPLEYKDKEIQINNHPITINQIWK